ncbi:MAG: hypothetical protein NVSMB57_09110 [Actinomycetota bacterium]
MVSNGEWEDARDMIMEAFGGISREERAWLRALLTVRQIIFFLNTNGLVGSGTFVPDRY